MPFSGATRPKYLFALGTSQCLFVNYLTCMLTVLCIQVIDPHVMQINVHNVEDLNFFFGARPGQNFNPTVSHLSPYLPKTVTVAVLLLGGFETILPPTGVILI